MKKGNIAGKRMTNQEYQNFIGNEIENALSLPIDFDNIIKPFTNNFSSKVFKKENVLYISSKNV